jgi:hypothetical protein
MMKIALAMPKATALFINKHRRHFLTKGEFNPHQ